MWKRCQRRKEEADSLLTGQGQLFQTPAWNIRFLSAACKGFRVTWRKKGPASLSSFAIGRLGLLIPSFTSLLRPLCLTIPWAFRTVSAGSRFVEIAGLSLGVADSQVLGNWMALPSQPRAGARTLRGSCWAGSDPCFHPPRLGSSQNRARSCTCSNCLAKRWK